MTMARSKDYDTPEDQPLEPPPEVAPPVTVPATDSAARLRDLRLLRERNQLNKADLEELERLSLAESEAAGHVVAKPE
jgi:hypothetical protein